MALNASSATEIFHLVFTHQLGLKVDKNLYAIKGGCNLRFYFQSIRYSEDIDFDVVTVARETLKKNVDVILASTSMNSILRTKKIEIVGFSAPKQSDKTQRWKIEIRHESSSTTVPTKIEFSRRDPVDEAILESVDAALISRYSLLPILSKHYPAEKAAFQKIGALINRTETQARDVFDLDLLASRVDWTRLKGKFSDDALDTAAGNAMTISLEQFHSQVVAYLLPEYQDHYSTKAVWDSMQHSLVEKLGAP